MDAQTYDIPKDGYAGGYSHRIVGWNGVDADGNPAGGQVSGMGISIAWQAGPVAAYGVNGADVTDVLEGCKQRLDFYQDSNFACDENEQAIYHLRSALNALRERTERRLMQGVEGKNIAHTSDNP